VFKFSFVGVVAGGGISLGNATGPCGVVGGGFEPEVLVPPPPPPHAATINAIPLTPNLNTFCISPPSKVEGQGIWGAPRNATNHASEVLDKSRNLRPIRMDQQIE
jgi:hypothetical protein